jgi:hypothetical protein
LCSQLGSCNEINLFDHLSDLFPKGSKIGFATFQNGIRNTLADFQNMGELISKKFSGNSLIIGLYNPTEGFLRDMDRVAGHNSGEMCPTVCRTRLMFSTLATQLRKCSPFLKWLHIAHSEAGAIAHLALRSILTPDFFPIKVPKGFLESHLITVTYGALFSIPKAFALETYNTYSDRDFTTKLWAEYFCRHKDYEVKFVESEKKIPASPLLGVASYMANWPIGFPPGDHDFQGDTYQKALISDIGDIRENYGIY